MERNRGQRMPQRDELWDATEKGDHFSHQTSVNHQLTARVVKSAKQRLSNK